MHQIDAEIMANRRLRGDYWQIDLAGPAVAAETQPGQFVHVRYPALQHHVLRRPFSVYDAEPETGTVRIVYKIVGDGTAHMAALAAGATVNLLGPLGRGFSAPAPGTAPIIVAGGYGCAATYLLAARSPVPPVVLIGGRTAADLLLTEEFARAGAEVRLATEDGSSGHRGLVTELLAPALTAAGAKPTVYACGPNPMLLAVAAIAAEHGLDAEISLDHVMCCGVGACFACVVQLKANNPDGWEYVRTCREGPVFKASRLWRDGR